ncbi:MAG: hypothetical protein WDO73_23205 [Ignavibacteriota bacterium]
MLESPWGTADPMEEYLLRANLEPRDILGADPRVEFENTNYLGFARNTRGCRCLSADTSIQRLTSTILTKIATSSSVSPS